MNRRPVTDQIDVGSLTAAPKAQAEGAATVGQEAPVTPAEKTFLLGLHAYGQVGEFRDIATLNLDAVKLREYITSATANLVAIDRDELEGLKTVAHAVSVLSKAMLDDPDFAWSWHCNIAMPIVDASGGAIGHADANKLATALMRHLFGVTTKEPTAPAAPNLVAIDRDKLEALRRDVQRLEAVRLAALGEIAYDAEPASEKYVTGTIQRAHRILSTGEPDGILKTAAIDSASGPRKGTP